MWNIYNITPVREDAVHDNSNFLEEHLKLFDRFHEITESSENKRTSLHSNATEMYYHVKKEDDSYNIDGVRNVESDEGKFPPDFSEEQYKIFAEDLNKEPNIFHKVVSRYLFGKSNSEYISNNHVFYLNLYDRYKVNHIDIYPLYINGDLFIDNVPRNLTEIRWAIKEEPCSIKKFQKLEDYIADNNIGIIDDKIKEELSEIKNNKNLSHEEIQDKINYMFTDFNSSYIVNEGVVSFFDFLGWKGICNRVLERDPLYIVDKIVVDTKYELKNCIDELLRRKHGYTNKYNSKISTIISISDTIAIFTPFIKDNGISEYELLWIHAKIANDIFAESIENNLPIRGAISFGEYRFKNNVFLGNGIDECAEEYEVCDWIGFHFTPKAEEIIEANISNKPVSFIMEYDKIPIKESKKKIGNRKYCVNLLPCAEVYENFLKNNQTTDSNIRLKYDDTLDLFKYSKRINSI